MKKKILRNVAAVSAIFIVTLAIMLVTSFFQVRGATPLQTEVVEMLKQLNDQNANNPELQEQIRQLDLMARKAYFVRFDHMVGGIYILLGMLAVFIVCVRLYYAEHKHIPDKEIDPIDEWALKSQARRYVLWSAAGVVTAALAFAVLTLPYLRSEKAEEEEQFLMASNEEEFFEEVSFEAEDAENESLPVAEESTAESVDVAEATVSDVTHSAFRGNNSNGISSARNLPARWNPGNGTNIAWRVPIPRAGRNSPVINGRRVFFTGADDQARELYCYDLFTGEKLWSLIVSNIPGSPAQMPRTSEDTGLAASTVATNGNVVCAVFATGDLICADMNGRRLWARNLGVPDNHYGYASSLLIFGNSLIVQYDNTTAGRVMALDISTGNERWGKARSEKTTWGSPSIAYVDSRPQLILMGNPSITAYNPNNGEELWKVDCLSGEVGTSAASSNGVIFGGSEYSTLIAIDGRDGSTLWTSNEFLPEVSSPVATRDNLYVATSYGVAASFDTKTGELRKEHDLGEEFYSSPIIAEGRIYLFGTSGKMHIFAANNDFGLLDSFETGEATYATPAFTDGRIVVRTESSIYCVAAN